ncbi:hypothetical protein [Streptomyces cavernicola]|uniref:Integral membrane protein n=1 Tax=Streptomyces cavernicola TaxID=3043613 RepID=A0ABT6S3G4_9ACTN|nr:hypothetical protein [Streptomyces sp. B-S-A6]MDI3402607.1 hypothetical protein [Streptomyces sp. B-S-A6]
MNLRLALRAPALWPAARWSVALGAALLSGVLLGLPTALVPNPFFGREIPPEWWSYPVLVASALLAGLLLATYVRTGAERTRDEDGDDRQDEDGDRPGEDGDRVSRLGSAGALLSFLAIGCPVCNKLVLLALGTSGALTVWAPLQPVLAVASLALLAVATVRRLAGEVACPATPAR